MGSAPIPEATEASSRRAMRGPRKVQTDACMEAPSGLVRKWCESGRVSALKTPGGAWRIPKSQFVDLEKVREFRQTVEQINERFRGFPETDGYGSRVFGGDSNAIYPHHR